MSRWISAEFRQTVADRANLLCEYCLIAEVDTFYGCEVDHIISLKHGGSSEGDNLAYAWLLSALNTYYSSSELPIEVIPRTVFAGLSIPTKLQTTADHR
jgi:hypothetical protein